jgi:asparagine synthetase B (glutamine-hydrolysing)
MHIWLLPLIKSLKNSTPINFDGISGDVLLKGLFMGEENLRYINKNQKEVALYILSKNKENKNILNLVFNKRISNKIFKKAIRSIKEELNKINENSNKITLFYMKNRTRREISIAPNNFINLKTENYFPFMDNDLVKFSLSIPPKLKVKNKIYKKALKRMFPEIMKIPSTNDEGIQKSKYAQKKAEIIRNSKESLNYFHELCQKFKLPKKILNLQYLDYVKKEIEKGKYPKGLEEYLRFVIWYNEYMA